MDKQEDLKQQDQQFQQSVQDELTELAPNLASWKRSGLRVAVDDSAEVYNSADLSSRLQLIAEQETVKGGVLASASKPKAKTKTATAAQGRTIVMNWLPAISAAAAAILVFVLLQPAEQCETFSCLIASLDDAELADIQSQVLEQEMAASWILEEVSSNASIEDLESSMMGFLDSGLNDLSDDSGNNFWNAEDGSSVLDSWTDAELEDYLFEDFEEDDFDQLQEFLRQN